MRAGQLEHFSNKEKKLLKLHRIIFLDKPYLKSFEVTKVCILCTDLKLGRKKAFLSDFLFLLTF